MRTPVVVVTGIDAAPVEATTMSLQWDLPGVAVVHHELDHERGLLVRVVSDATGIVERDEIELAHLCLGCAATFEIVPTLDRLARQGRWGSLVARLPLGASAEQVCTPIATDPRRARRLRIGAVVTALADSAAADLLGEETLDERNPDLPADDRGVGEVLGAMVEYADVVVGSGDLPSEANALIRALARPDTTIVPEASSLGVGVAAGADGGGPDPDGTQGRETLLSRYRHAVTAAWTDPLAVPNPVVPAVGAGVWQVLVDSPLPFHPERLLEELESLGSGPFRTRGVFWLATRPGDALLWDGAGGQLSIGTHDEWGTAAPRTRLLFTGLGTAPPGLVSTFESLLDEQWRDGATRRTAEDGFEPWLGEIRSIA